MDCKAVRSHVTPYIDNELEPDVKRELLAHLDLCRSCRERLEGELRFEQAIVRRLPCEDMPQELWRRLQTRIRAEVRPRRRGILLAIGISVAAAGLFAVGLFLAVDAERPDLERAVLDLHRRIEAGAEVSEMQPVPAEKTDEFLKARAETRPFADRVARSLDIGSHHYKFVGVASVTMMERQFACLEYACCGERICVVVMPSEYMAMFPGMQAALARSRGTLTDSEGATNFEARMIGNSLVCFVAKHPLEDLAVAYAGE